MRVKFKNLVNEKFGIVLSDIQLQNFEIYIKELISWNKKTNLTSIIEPEKILYLHFADSLAGISAMNSPDFLNSSIKENLNPKIIDVGTGAGFPGIPIKIVLPEIKLTLLESSKKKCFFLENLIQKLNLQNVEVIWSTAELLAHNSLYRHNFDTGISRAVNKTSVLLELTSAFIKIGGRIIFWKTEKEKREIFNSDCSGYFVGNFGVKYFDKINYTLPEQKFRRYLFIFDKIEKTVEKFPRRSGIPNKYPL